MIFGNNSSILTIIHLINKMQYYSKAEWIHHGNQISKRSDIKYKGPKNTTDDFWNSGIVDFGVD